MSLRARMARRVKSAAAAFLSVAAGAASFVAAADPAVWHVAGPRGAEVWLLGSIHVLHEQDYPLPANIDGLFEGADELLMELDFDDPGLAEQQRTLLATAVLPQGTVLSDVLPPGTYATAKRRTQALGMDLELLEDFEPWFIAITVLDLSLQAQGYESRLGVEQYLAAKARAAGKPIAGLESPAEQLAIFDNLAPEAQIDLLEQSLEEAAAAGSEMEEVTAAWRDGRLEELGDDLLAEFAPFPGLYEEIVVERNGDWIAPLEALLASERKVLVVVGALHLVGEDSVIAKLVERGHAVRRVGSPP